MKDYLGVKIMTEFAASKPKTYSYLTDSNNEKTPAKEHKEHAIKRNLKSEDYKH